MRSPDRPYAICFLLGLTFFLLSTFVSGVIARTTIGSEQLAYAVSQHAYYAATQPLGTGLLLVPFLLMAWMGAALARRKSLRSGVIFLSVACTALAFIYFLGYQDSQHYMAHRMWTAATLAVGLLIVKSIPVLVVALITFLFVRRGERVEP
jgi:hypothetical protein